MKDFIKNTVIMLLVTLTVGAMPTEAEGEIYEDTIRLHILANSDSELDQELKLAIRDEVLKKYGQMLSAYNSVSEAKENISSLLTAIECDVESWIKDMGYEYGAKATLSEEWYDRREYDGFTLPAGYYSSLRIIIGEGDGKNWWCVMYPPLCMDIATEQAPSDDGFIDYTKEELALIKNGEYQIKFKILEELSRAFAKNS